MAEFEHVVRLLEDSYADIQRSLTGLEPEFCCVKPTGGGWSIAEIMEHLAVIEERVPRLLRLKLPNGEAVPDVSDSQKKDAEIVERVQSYTNKIDAPEAVKPTGRYGSCRDALATFHALRQETLAYAASAPAYLRGRTLPHPLLGPIDGCQWLLALAAHSQRHVRQINEIKAALHSQVA